MPNIKVVTQQPKQSPLNEFVIDLEETVNPLAKSNRSVRMSRVAPQPIAEGEEPAIDADSDDDGTANMKVVPIDDDEDERRANRDAIKTANTGDLLLVDK